MVFDPRPVAGRFGELTRSLMPLAADFSTIVSTTARTRLLAAVRSAHDQWRLQARFQNILITGHTAFGPPGCLAGPRLESLIRSAPDVLADQDSAGDLRDAVARGVSDCFADWQDGVMVPGLPWYPAFLAVAGPMAPPTPNIPTPLVTCPSAMAFRLTKAALQEEILMCLPSALRVQQVETGVGAIAESLAQYFSIWLASQMVQDVLGQGPVPTFAPPGVPAGPVAAGFVIPAPGHLASGGLPQMITL